MTDINITLNDAPVQVAAGTSVAGLLELRGVSEGGTAVAVNGSLVRHPQWGIRILEDGDKVLVISAAYGG